MTPFQTNRLFIRKAVEEDVDFILALLNNPSWLRYIGDRGVRNINDALEYINNSLTKSYSDYNHGLMVMETQESKKAIGLCGLLQRDYLKHPDLGFAILPTYARKGYTVEACRAIIDNAMDELDKTTIYAITTNENEASKKVLERLQFNYLEDIQSHHKENFLLYQFKP